MTTSFPPARVWQLPASLPADLAGFEKNVALFQQGALSATQFQVFRVPQGVYEQREAGTYMLRVRFPAGVALPHQLRTLAEVAERFGDGILHVTTRQDIQVHRVRVEAIHPALALLAEAGLSTKGGGGNTVRNITACPDAGVCAQEAFDVTPQVLGLTEFMLGDPQSFQLPRKYKIAFAGCGQSCSGATVNDLGFIARWREGVAGFAVYAGGGFGSQGRVAGLLHEFVPAAEAPWVAEAVKRVFNAHGNRKDKRQARLRFLVRQLGFEAFKKLCHEQLEILRQAAPALPRLRPVPHPEPVPPPHPDAPSTSGSSPAGPWAASQVAAQKQAGWFTAELPLLLGDIPSDKLRALAGVVERHGEKLLRTTQQQNFVLRWVRQEELEPLWQELSALGLARPEAPILRHLVACTGAATCKLGICLSRGLAEAVASRLSSSTLDLPALGNLQISISGCPNGCGRHPVADIGLYGAARRIAGHLVPHYVVQTGGSQVEGQARLAAGHHAIPARNIPDFVAGLLAAFQASEQRADFQAFLTAAGGAVVEQLAGQYKTAPAGAAADTFRYDWTAREPFSLAGRGPGECGAGVFDLIEVDLKSAAEALQEQRYFAATALAARALLVTRGEQAPSDAEALGLFQKHFLEARLVEEKFRPLVALGLRAAQDPHPAQVFLVPGTEVEAFVSAVQALFKNMDATLQFARRPEPAPVPAPPLSGPAAPAETADLEKDFRGVVCPLNYVKTKLALDRLQPGQVLSVLLDPAGAQKVPDSAAADGHSILSIARKGDDYTVLIRKRGRG